MSSLPEGENMAERTKLTTPRFVTCQCHHCNGGIEFDANDFQAGETRPVECPHCHKETIIYVESLTERLTPKQFSDFIGQSSKHRSQLTGSLRTWSSRHKMQRCWCWFIEVGEAADEPARGDARPTKKTTAPCRDAATEQPFSPPKKNLPSFQTRHNLG
jgi:hypothetical protein